MNNLMSSSSSGLGHQLLIKGGNKMITIKKVPQELIFKNGEIVEVNGDFKSGIGKVFATFYPNTQPTGEMAYGTVGNEPFPQIGIKFGNGLEMHYNADDLLSGKIKRTNKNFEEPKKLEEFLNEIIIDASQAAQDLGYYGESLFTLKEACDKIMKFIKPLLKYKVRLCSDKECFLGEFDSYEFIFKAEKEGTMMCDSGIPAFELYINVDGYIPTTMKLFIHSTMQQ